MNSLLVVFTIVLSTAALPVGQHGPEDKREDVFRKVPEDQREQLSGVVEKLIEAEEGGDWKSVFELVEKRPGQTEDSFVKEMQRRRLLHELASLSLTFVPPEEGWILEGCANFDGDGKGVGKYSTIHARWKDSRWYLSGIAFELFEKGKIRKCLIPRAKPAVLMHRTPPAASTIPPVPQVWPLTFRVPHRSAFWAWGFFPRFRLRVFLNRAGRC